MPSEWRIDVSAAEQEHYDKYGFLPGDEWHEDSAPVLETDTSWSWDYPDPLSR